MNSMTQFQNAQLPSAFQSLMQQMDQNELAENVGANFAVVSIKGKAFRIKHGGTETPLTMEYQGQIYPAPNFDVVIPMASPHLAKTYYPSGYTEGSDESPKCWSEDGLNPLAPLTDRPIVPQTGQHCVDCRTCPMNAFGSKVSTDAAGGNGKACSDTRKVIVLPTKQVGLDGAGHPIIAVDAENVKYGGAMLLRVPAASLKAVAEYSRKLQAMGIPYCAVITRLTFDQTVAYPRLVLEPLRPLTEQEAGQVIEVRGSQQVSMILQAAQASAPQLAAPAPQAAPVDAYAQAAAQVYAPQAAPPMPTVAPVAPQAPATAAPVMQAPMAPAPVQMAPAPVPVQMAPTVPAPAPAAAFPGFAPTAPAPAPVQMAPAPAMPAAAPAAATVNAGLLGRIDDLLDT